MINKSELKDLLKEVMTPIISESIDKALKANFKRPDETENEWVNFKEAQKILRDMPRGTLYALSSKNLIPKSKRGRRVYFKKSDLYTYLNKGSIPSIYETIE
ncbi:MAG: helix-turn-helix domain-containing protein [Bacteroidota bacterium]|nr:MAG: helix-turn-helix domain-containing protein [Bacteroidota bacterium]